MISLIILTLICIPIISLIFDRLQDRRDRILASQKLPVGYHVVISGGSKGIGKSLAERFAKLGAHVTIIARNEKDLALAKKDIEKARRNSHIQTVNTVSLDLTKINFPDNSTQDLNNKQHELLEKILGQHGRCDVLVNCCGSASPARFMDTSQAMFHHMMDVNYFSAVNLTRLLLPVMKMRSLSIQGSYRMNTRVVFVSSMCGLMSFFGYSAYAASKFAIVGLAEALNMELKPFDIGVTVSFPPDTDTPGFEEENKSKPALTSRISQSGNIYNPDQVAIELIKDIRAKKFYSTVGLENLAVLTASNTFMPAHSIWTVILESFIVGPLRLVGFLILRSWYGLVQDAAVEEISKAEEDLRSYKNQKPL